jgi:hypothetical protein
MRLFISIIVVALLSVVARAVTFSPHGIQTDSYNYTIVNVLSNNFLALAEVLQGSASPFTLRGGTLVAQSVSNAALADAAVTSAKIADAAIAAVDIGDGQVSSSKLAHAGVWLTVATKPELIAATNAGVARAAWSFVAETASNAMSATQLSAVSNIFFLLSGANHPSYFPALTADVVRFRLSMRAGDEGGSYVLAKNNGNLDLIVYQYGGSPNNAGVRFMPYAWELYITNAPGGSGLTPVHVGAPTKTSHAVTKAYADAISNAAHAAYVNKAGDTMTGNLTLPAGGALMAGLYGGLYSGMISIDATDGDDIYNMSVIKLSALSTVVVDRCILDMVNHRVVGVASPTAASDAATKGYVDGITNAFVSRAVAVTNTGDSIISRFTFVGGLLQSFTQQAIP